MAGLAAARSLADAGWPVRVIEARDRIGGRVHTSRDWGVPLEMGASWIHGTTNNPLMELAAQVHADVVPTDYDDPAKLVIDPRLQPMTFNHKTWRRLVSEAREEVNGGSLGAAITAQADREELTGRDAPPWTTTSPPRSKTSTPPTPANFPPPRSTSASTPTVRSR